jgi:hypothetical protein
MCSEYSSAARASVSDTTTNWRKPARYGFGSSPRASTNSHEAVHHLLAEDVAVVAKEAVAVVMLGGERPVDELPAPGSQTGGAAGSAAAKVDHPELEILAVSSAKSSWVGAPRLQDQVVAPRDSAPVARSGVIP